MRRPFKSLEPLLGFLFACVFLLNLVSSLGAGQLTAYSETRSFRDALEGRSMEEAISGPVDKDTSSYGDRTSGGGSSGQQAPSSQTMDGAGVSYESGASASSPGDSAASSAGQMMINIPANGNLNPTQQMDEQQQQQQSSGGELEREAGPISPDFPMDTQQQMMEQKMMMMMKAKQMMAGRSGRLTGSAPSSSMMMEMLRSMREERKKKMMGQMGARSGRLQQEQQQEDEQQQQQGGTKQAEGDEAGNSGYGAGQMVAPSSGYGKKMNAANGGSKPYDSKSMQDGEGQQQQQQMMMMMNGGQEGASYDQQQQQQQPAEMGAKYSQMMNNGGDKEGGAYGKQQAGNMGQTMMMSLANKAAYMASQRMPSARQTAPMMMTPAMGPMPMSMAGRSAGQSYGAQGQYGMQMPRASGYQQMRAGGAMRAMRRANQRRSEKKMSPAMMNAMLNKMLMSSQYQAGGMGMKPASDSGYSGASQQQMSMSAAKMKAEMLAKLMMMSMAGNGNGGNGGYGGYGASPMGNNKRDSYKMMPQQMMMMMNQDEEQKTEMPMEQMSGGNYGDRSMPSGMSMGKSTPASGGYGDQDSAQKMTPSPYGGASMGSQSPMTDQGYGQQQQQMQQQMPAMGNNYDMQQQQEMAPETKGMQQQPMMMMMPKSYGMGSGSPMMSSMRMVPAKGQSYGKGGDSSSSERPAMNGKLMQQVMKVMRAKQMAMSQQGKSAYGAGDQQQMQMPSESKDYAGESQRMQPKVPSYGGKSDEGTKGAQAKGMNRPMMPMSMGMSYDSQQQTDDGQEQQQQMGGSGYEQTKDQYGGAAPMGQAEPFAFDYKVEDEATGNNQYRKEESDKNGVVRGSYGYMDSNSGVYRHVEYVADENGFRANIKSNEPGLSDKTTSKQTKTQQPQQQPQQQQMEEGGQSGGGDQAGTKGSSEASYQPARGQAPPSSSSSLGGSAALQMGAPMSKTSQPMEEQMPQQQMMQSMKMPQEQQQQQQQASELEK